MTKKIFTFFDQNPKTHQVSWFKEVKADLASIGISEEYIRNRTIFKNKVKEFKGFEERARRRGGPVWSEERREQHRERMKIYWIRRRNEPPKIEEEIRNHT